MTRCLTFFFTSGFAVLFLWHLPFNWVCGQGTYPSVASQWELIRPSVPSTMPFQSVYFFNQSSGFVTDTAGALFRTADGGNSWSRVALPVEYENANWHDIFFTNENNGWLVGTYSVMESDGKAAMLRTTDGGTTWTSNEPMNALSTAAWTHKALLSMHFYDETNGFSSGRKGTLLQTTDGGASWSTVTITPAIPMDPVPEEDIGEVYVQEESVWLATQGGLFVSGDLGATWTRAREGDFRGIYVEDRREEIWACGAANLVLSTDSGDSWLAITPPAAASSFFMDVMLVGNELWLVEYGGANLWNSQDEGRNWERLSQTGNTILGVHSVDGLMVWVVGGDSTRAEAVNHIFATYDRGNVWYNLKGVGHEDLHAVYGLGEEAWIAGEGGILKTTDHGTSWRRYAVADGFSSPLHGVYFNDASNGWVVSEGGHIYKSENGGTNWLLQREDNTQSFRSLHFTDAQNGFAVGTDGAAALLCQTADGGENWSCTSLSVGTMAHAVSFFDANNGWIVGEDVNTGRGFIFRTTDGGTWGQVTSIDTLNPTALYDIYVESTSRLWAAGKVNDGGTEKGEVFFSDDDSLTWTRQINATDATPALRSVGFISNTDVFAMGEDGSCYHADNGGISWSACADNFIGLSWQGLHARREAAYNSWAVGEGAIILRNRGNYIDLVAATTALDLAAGNVTFEVFSNLPNWTLSINAAWATMNPQTGSNSATIGLDYEAATTTRQVIVTATDGTIVEEITFTQRETSIHFLPAPDERGNYALDPVGGVHFFNILSGVSWAASYNADWIIDITPHREAGAKTMAIRYKPNEGATAADRSTVVTLSEASGKKTVFTLTQEVVQFDSSQLPTELSVSRRAGYYTFYMPTNSSWHIKEELDMPWLAVSQSGEKGDYATISYQDMPGDEDERIGNVVVNVGSFSHVIIVVQSNVNLATQPKSKILPAAAGTYSFTVDASLPWRLFVKNEAPWLSFSTSEGLNTQKVTITYEAQDTTFERVAILEVVSDGAAQTMLITQQPQPINILHTNSPVIGDSEDGPLPLQYGDFIRVGSLPGTILLDLIAADAWTLSTLFPADWINIDTTAGLANEKTALSISYKENLSPYDRAIILVASAGGNKSLFTILQKENRLKVAPTIIASIEVEEELVSSEAKSVGIKIESNSSWTVSANAHWVDLDTASGEAGKYFIVATYTQNTTQHLRNADIVLIVDDVRKYAALSQSTKSSDLLDISISDALVSHEAGSVILQISSLGEWSLSVDAFWVTIDRRSGNNDTTLQVIYSENFDELTREAIITVKNDFFTKEIRFTQQQRFAQVDQFFHTEIQDPWEVIVYPNPTETVLFVESTSQQRWCTTLLDMGGKTYQTACAHAHTKMMLPTSSLAEGVYLLKVSAAEGTHLQRIIKKDAR